MKVAVFETEEWEHQACLRLEPAHVVSCTREPLDMRTAAAHAEAEIVSTFVNSKLGADVLAQFPRLKLIATRSTGYDHIDLDWCAANCVTVANAPDYGDSTVAEHAFALLLAVARNLVEAVERTRRGNFSQTGLRGLELRDTVLGVIGTGRIGRRVIEIARGFGMAVVAHELYPDAQAAARLDVAKSLIAGCDVWLNTPQPPMEASGTSGMKAAINGVLNLSTLDGWWVEAHIEGVTGWSIGTDEVGSHEDDAEELYEKLAGTVLALFYDDPARWRTMMRHALGNIAYYFNSQRMMRRYASEAYLR